jgi:hypothetical protein
MASSSTVIVPSPVHFARLGELYFGDVETSAQDPPEASVWQLTLAEIAESVALAVHDLHVDFRRGRSWDSVVAAVFRSSPTRKDRPLFLGIFVVGLAVVLLLFDDVV